MEKKEIIEKTKKAYQLYKENKIYHAFKEIYPVAQKVKTEKVQKLYKVITIKAKQLLEDLYNSGELNKLEEIEYMFFEGVNIPAIKKIFQKAREDRKKLLEQLKEEEDLEDFSENSSTYQGISLEDNYTEDEKNESESFDFNADNFKLSSFSEDEMGEQDVNALIQKGVSLYEVGDIENALVVWEKALQLQPENDFVKEYIANARRELGDNTVAQDIDSDSNYSDNSLQEFQTDTPSLEPEQNDELKEKEEEVEIIFDEENLSGELKRAIAIARSGDVERANKILNSLYSNNQINENQYKNAKKFISKIEKEVGVTIVKNKLKNMINDKDFENALNYLKKNRNRLSVEEANRIEQLIMQKKQEQALSQSFELELDEQPETKLETTKSKPILKRENIKLKARKNIKHKNKKSNLSVYFKTTFFFILLIVILAVVIFYGIKVIQSNIQTDNTAFDIQTFQLQELEKQKKARFNKYIKEARNYFDLGEYLFAYYTYLHAERFGKLNEQQIAFLSKARRLMKQEAINKRKELRLAERYYKTRQYEKAIPHYKNLLSENPEDLTIKEKLFDCYKKTAINYALNNNVLKAKTYFKYALVLNRNDSEIPKHLKVLDRYLKGQINQRLLTQWFYFYIK
ncbi:hypothetical protein TTHT_0771 [Thermotomaculum hydrothermale]|uniref:Tetratricopeptide repeat protein n=1 Tax=Thermotomaculum hydrothermale TaxID=981385 RepID=A0A7R6PTH3_9BACT|nr:hypothetical protein [Thermotomaculum hydrothermale]BBB32337.1 hypothetical protein TTHT_0771 [Thermotomaculum hydrothermale]